MDTCICCIVKKENLYLRDWVRYHRALGFSRIFLYDNNDIEGEYPQEVIGDYISEGYVIYRDVRGRYRCQLEAYTEHFKEESGNYDWLMYTDIDEYLVLNHGVNIKTYLSSEKFADCSGIMVYWRRFGDNNLLHYDSRPVYERFTHYVEEKKGSKCTPKYILRGKGTALHDVVFNDANSIGFTFFEVPIFRTENGRQCTENDNMYEIWSYDEAYLNHYQTLSIEEFLYRRFGRRGYADKDSSFETSVVMNIFTSLNEWTEEKKEIADDFFRKFRFKEDKVLRKEQ